MGMSRYWSNVARSSDVHACHFKAYRVSWQDMSPNKETGIHLPEKSDLRVSCAAFAKITFQNRYCLIVNNHRLQTKGERILTPIGGAIKVSLRGKSDLCSLLSIPKEAFENGLDLRFTMHGKYANALKYWFLSGLNRETNPLRELGEELVTETDLLLPEDLNEVTYGLPVRQTELAQTDRSGHMGQLTLRMLEVFPVYLPERAVQKLLQASNMQDSMVKFVTAQEIVNRVSKEGITIGSVANTLVEPDPSLTEFLNFSI